MLKHLTALAIVAFLVTLGVGNPAQAGNVSVTFQVHMGAFMQTGAFNPVTDSVIIRGSFQVLGGDTAHYGGNQNWGGTYFVMSQSLANDSIYTLAVTFGDTAVGDTIQYQFLPEHAGNASWVEPGNRTYTITSAASQTLPLAYIANKMPGIAATINITFQIDATELLAQGFNPAVDSVYVVGDTSPLNWGPSSVASTTMIPSLADPSILEVTLSFTDVVGFTVNFKLFGNGSDPFSNGGWESGGNHTFTFPNVDTTVTWTPDLNVTKPALVADTVTFHIDMISAFDGINYKPITGVKSVWITGSVAPLNWPPSGWPLADTSKGDTANKVDTTAQIHRMYDDGTHGDSVAGDNNWTIKLVFSPGVSSYVEYKYGAVFNGYDTLSVGGVVSGGSLIDNECASGVNHSVVLSGTKESIYNHFGDQDPNNPWTPLSVKQKTDKPIVFALSQNYPNPFNPTTQINYSVPKNSFVTLKIYNVLGQQVATLFTGNLKAGDYTSTFDASKFASGVYFYRLQAGSLTNVKKMVLMK